MLILESEMLGNPWNTQIILLFGMAGMELQDVASLKP